ncbi:MAG: hypothetical protein WCE80_14470 [Acidimicrobiia bacterium]
MTSRRTMKAKTLLTVLAMAIGVVALGAQPALAASCGPAPEWGDNYYSYATFSKYEAVCDYLAVRGWQGVPGEGQQWSPYAYDYTVGNAHSDWNVKNYIQYPPCLNWDGYSYLSA